MRLKVHMAAMQLKYLRRIFVEVHEDDLANGPWGLIISTAILGALLTSVMGWAFVGLSRETGDVVPPIIFTGAEALGGLFLLLGSLVEGTKKVVLLPSR